MCNEFGKMLIGNKCIVYKRNGSLQSIPHIKIKIIRKQILKTVKGECTHKTEKEKTQMLMADKLPTIILVQNKLKYILVHNELSNLICFWFPIIF